MPSRSCTSQLIGVLDKIGNFLDRGEQIDVIYLDMTKAFDRVNHELLLSKLRHFGFKNNLLNWFQSYLFQRRQQVTVLGSTSSSLPVVSGVPQGSILGPVLFLLYVNDLPDAVSSSTVATFADDTKLFKTIACKADSLKLPEDLNTLTQWSTSTNLAFNPAKCLFAVMKNGLFNTNVSGALFPLGMVTWPPWNNSTTVLTSIVLRVQPLMTTMQLVSGRITEMLSRPLPTTDAILLAGIKRESKAAHEFITELLGPTTTSFGESSAILYGTTNTGRTYSGIACGRTVLTFARFSHLLSAFPALVLMLECVRPQCWKLPVWAVWTGVILSRLNSCGGLRILWKCPHRVWHYNVHTDRLFLFICVHIEDTAAAMGCQAVWASERWARVWSEDEYLLGEAQPWPCCIFVLSSSEQ